MSQCFGCNEEIGFYDNKICIRRVSMTETLGTMHQNCFSAMSGLEILIGLEEWATKVKEFNNDG